MNRNLDTLFYNYNGRMTSFSDLPEEEQDRILNQIDDKQELRMMCKVLAFNLRETGDYFDVANNFNEDYLRGRWKDN